MYFVPETYSMEIKKPRNLLVISPPLGTFLYLDLMCPLCIILHSWSFTCSTRGCVQTMSLHWLQARFTGHTGPTIETDLVPFSLWAKHCSVQCLREPRPPWWPQHLQGAQWGDGMLRLLLLVVAVLCSLLPSTQWDSSPGDGKRCHLLDSAYFQLSINY